VIGTEAMHSGVITGWDAFQTLIDAGRGHDLPAPDAITPSRVYVHGYRDVLAWAAAFGVAAQLYDGSHQSRTDWIQASADLPQVGLGRYLDVIGSAPCQSAGTDHDHASCIADAAQTAAARP